MYCSIKIALWLIAMLVVLHQCSVPECLLITVECFILLWHQRSVASSLLFVWNQKVLHNSSVAPNKCCMKVVLHRCPVAVCRVACCMLFMLCVLCVASKPCVSLERGGSSVVAGRPALSELPNISYGNVLTISRYRDFHIC